MSHLVSLKLKVKDLTTLSQAAQRLGMVLNEQQTYRWWGKWMKDSPIPVGLKEEDMGKCKYALSIPGNQKAYEVGVVPQSDGSYSLLWDSWSGGYGLMDKIGPDGCKLISEYEATVYRNQMISEGYEISEVVLEDGSREIMATQY